MLVSINGHWQAIREGRFEHAYGYLGPGVASGESKWVSDHEADGITSVSYQFHVVENDGSTAKVGVDQLQTQDAHGCRNWSGDYTMIKLDGQWLINGTTIQPTPC